MRNLSIIIVTIVQTTTLLMDLNKLFSDTQLLIIENLQVSYQEEAARVFQLELELKRHKEVIADLISMCEYEGLSVRVCDAMRLVVSVRGGVSRVSGVSRVGHTETPPHALP